MTGKANPNRPAAYNPFGRDYSSPESSPRAPEAEASLGGRRTVETTYGLSQRSDPPADTARVRPGSLPMFGKNPGGSASRGTSATRPPSFDESLRSRASELGLTIIPNGGLDQDLSLVISMLRHADVWAVDEGTATLPAGSVEALRAHQQLAAVILGEFVMRDDAAGKALREDRSLCSDPKAVAALAEHIFGVGNVPPMLVMGVGEQGLPVLFDPMRSQKDGAVDVAMVPHRTAVLLVTQGRVEPIANASGRPWRMVLTQLQMDSQARQDGVVALHAQAIQATENKLICLSGADDSLSQLQWQLGAQRDLEPLDTAPNPDDLARARDFAAAQHAVDDFWEAIGSCQAKELLHLKLADGDQIYGLGLSTHAYLHANRGGLEDQYIATVRLRANRVISLHIQSEGDGEINVRYETDDPHTTPTKLTRPTNPTNPTKSDSRLDVEKSLPTSPKEPSPEHASPLVFSPLAETSHKQPRGARALPVAPRTTAWTRRVTADDRVVIAKRRGLDPPVSRQLIANQLGLTLTQVTKADHRMNGKRGYRKRADAPTQDTHDTEDTEDSA